MSLFHVEFVQFFCWVIFLNILILTNMCKTEAEPSSGLYVRRQFEFLKQHANNPFDFYYYDIPLAYRQSTSSIKRYLGFFFTFVKNYVFTRQKYDLLHIHFFFPTILLAIFYKIFRSPSAKIVVTFHGNDVYHYHEFKWWYRMCFRFVDKAIFVSESLKNNFFKSNVSHEIFCAGIDPVFQFKEKSYVYDFIFVGHLNENKGVGRLIDLISKLNNNNKLLIVGSGSMSKLVQQHIKDDSVRLIPHCSPQELVSLYHQSKWLLNLSYHESFGLSIAEALVCGVPVIATVTDGAIAQVDSNVNGLLMEQDSDIAQQVIDRSSSVSSIEYRAMEKNAKKHKSNCSIDVITEKNLTIYRNLLL